MELFKKIREGLQKTREAISSVLSFQGADEAQILDRMLEALILADAGGATSEKLVEAVRKKAGRKAASDTGRFKSALVEALTETLSPFEGRIDFNRAKPFVIMVAGVNGVGKTTTIGKIAHIISSDGKSVIVSAGDTFRAAAVEQLEIWAGRSGAEVVKHSGGADPAAVAYDSAKAAVARGRDVLIVDTAGRLHTKSNLMNELKKVKKVIGREIPGAPHETLLVLDSTTGQNALNQARAFHKDIGLTGLVLTKLDSSAKGGTLIGIADEMKLPVFYIGVGEGMEDLKPFSAREYAEGLVE